MKFSPNVSIRSRTPRAVALFPHTRIARMERVAPNSRPRADVSRRKSLPRRPDPQSNKTEPESASGSAIFAGSALAKEPTGDTGRCKKSAARLRPATSCRMSLVEELAKRPSSRSGLGEARAATRLCRLLKRAEKTSSLSDRKPYCSRLCLLVATCAARLLGACARTSKSRQVLAAFATTSAAIRRNKPPARASKERNPQTPASPLFRQQSHSPKAAEAIASISNPPARRHRRSLLRRPWANDTPSTTRYDEQIFPAALQHPARSSPRHLRSRFPKVKLGLPTGEATSLGVTSRIRSCGKTWSAAAAVSGHVLSACPSPPSTNRSPTCPSTTSISDHDLRHR